jgi:hypothetical protein
MRPFAVFLVLLLGFGATAGNAAVMTGQNGNSRPTVFEPEDKNLDFENAKSPSDAVLNALLKTEEVTGDPKALEGRSREALRQMFEVVSIDLGNHNETDYVVLGKGPMIGADCYWFWIVRDRQGRGEVLLFSNGLSLALRKHATNGYRDIESDWATAGFVGQRLYRYNGSVYKLEWEHTKENKE